MQPREVISDGILRFEVEKRNQDVRQHVAGDEHTPFFDHQRGMTRRVTLVLDDPDPRSIPRNLRRVGG